MSLYVGGVGWGWVGAGLGLVLMTENCLKITDLGGWGIYNWGLGNSQLGVVKLTTADLGGVGKFTTGGWEIYNWWDASRKYCTVPARQVRLPQLPDFLLSDAPAIAEHLCDNLSLRKPGSTVLDKMFYQLYANIFRSLPIDVAMAA